MDKTQNELHKAKRFYGLHFAPGLAEYQYEDGAKRVFISEPVAKRMDTTFEGKPIYIDHIDEIGEKEFHNAQGYVVKSFYNEADGNHWAEFIVKTKEAEREIRNGKVLSNAYFMTEKGPEGEWHGMTYEEEVLDAEYEHLAIVDNPRYAESVILTPEEFKKYNEGKKGDLDKYMNEKENGKMKLNIFKKEKVKNSDDFAGVMVELPESKAEKTIEEIVAVADAAEMKGTEGYELSFEEVVKVGDKTVTIGDLVECYKMHMGEDMPAEDDVVEPVEADEADVMVNEDDDDKAENMDDDKAENEDEDEIENEDDDDEDKKENTIAILKNASKKVVVETKTIDLMHNKIGRGSARYGS